VIKNILGKIVWFTTFCLLSACDSFTDPATRIAYDIEANVKHLRKNGDKFAVQHQTPSKRGECEGPYKVQVDKVGALIIWCYSDAGAVVSSHSTSYHNRFADTLETRIVDKGTGETLTIELEQRGARVVIVNVL
jgi:hypothetical protein